MAFFEECDDILTNAIGQKILNNQNLCKLLYYYSDVENLSYNPLSQPDIANTRDLLLKNIFPMPKSPDAQTDQTGYLTVVLSGGSTNYDTNQGYRKVYLVFDIIVHLKQWIIKNSYRVYRIAEEIDKMFNNQITDLPIEGRPVYMDFKQRDYSNSFYGIQLVYELTINSNVTCNPVPQILSSNKVNTILNRN